MSIRVVDPAAIALINSRAAGLVLLLQLDYSPAVRVNSSGMNIEFNGGTFLRTGTLGTVDKVSDTAGEITGLRFALSAVPAASVALALGESARNKRCRLWVGIANADTRVIADAPLLFDGVLDQMPLQLKGNQSTIAATAVHMGAVFARARSFLYSDAEQQAEAPGDTCGRFLVSQAQHKDTWPAAAWGRQ